MRNQQYWYIIAEIFFTIFYTAAITGCSNPDNSRSTLTSDDTISVNCDSAVVHSLADNEDEVEPNEDTLVVVSRKKDTTVFRKVSRSKAKSLEVSTESDTGPH